jgi:hypothetical protein
METRTLKWRRVGGTVLIVHARVLPDETEWNAFIADSMSAPVENGLVFCEVSLNPAQRRQVAAAHRVNGCRSVAVITSSLLTRVLIRTLNWMSNKHRAFDPSEVVAAFDFLGTPHDQRHELLALALRFARELKLSQLEHTLSA